MHRDVYEAFYIFPNGQQKRVIIKVPKTEKASIQARINLSRGDPNRRDAEKLISLNHPNIVQIIDTLEYEDSIITIEKFYDAQSLQQHVEMFGPILNQDKFLDIFSQTAEALRYLHLGKRMLHRDVKPSNFLIGIDGKVKLTDFQFAASLDEVIEKALPTRGGTQYTHPKMLEELLSGRESCVTVGAELYSLGAVMYYVLTGEHLFDFALVEDDYGPKIEIEGKPMRIAIAQEGKLQHHLDLRECLRHIQEKLGKVYFPEFKCALSDVLNPGEINNADAKELHKMLADNFETYRKHRIRPFVWMNISELKAGEKVAELARIKVEGQDVPLREFAEQHRIMPDGNGGKSIVLCKAELLENLALSSLIEGIVSFATAFGKWNRETHCTGNPDARGSDAYDSNLCIETYSFRDGNLEAKVIDERSTLRYGTMGQNWSDDYTREIIMSVNGEEIFHAYNHLGGETCYSHEPILKKGGFGWLITKLAPLGYVVEQADKMRGSEKDTISIKLKLENPSTETCPSTDNEYDLENALSLAEQEQLQWTPTSSHKNCLVRDYASEEGARAYTAVIDGWQATVVHFNSNQEPEDNPFSYRLLLHHILEENSAFIYGDPSAQEFPLPARERIKKIYKQTEEKLT